MARSALAFGAGTVFRKILAIRPALLLALGVVMANGLASAAASIPGTRPAIAAATQAVEKAGTPAAATSSRDGRLVRVLNRFVCVSFDETEARWDVAWMGKPQAALLRAGASIEIDGKALRPADVKSEITKASDRLGSGLQLTHGWGEAVHIEYHIAVHDNSPAVMVSARIKNGGNHDVVLGTASLLDVRPEHGGWWYVGDVAAAPAAVFLGGASELLCQPASDQPGDQGYSSSGILALTDRGRSAGLAVGYLTAREARPDVAARFKVGQGGMRLAAASRFLGRKLAPGQSLDLDTLYLSAHANPYEAMEQYGNAAAACAEQPVRKGANSLWCSWYAHRMSMSEDLVLANAAVAARHFKPLGLDMMQLDHGWQRGDITGDWVPNERFPHGFKWLADELRTRYGMKLGVWIAPTDVAETSETFKKHPDWMLKGEDGKPLVNWKWYWKPNPNCYELDPSNPAAAKWMEDVFAELTASGVSYFKIDFLYASGGEQFRQFDPYCTRGWSVLHQAMESVRRGAGPKAWIRYCQAPPLLAAGLADSAYGGSDTLDAGLGGNIEVLRTNARSLAASYWLNDRLYHREVCDMSVRMQADIEETRMRLAMMTLAGCSVSFSDELQYLPPSRIHMMQQCLPPGCPPMRPLDLFDRTIPSVWHVHCGNSAEQWDVVGLFNFENRPEERMVEFTALGLPADAEAAVFEFWEEKLLGISKNKFAMMLPAQSSRVLSIRRLTGRPQVIGTDMHLLQGQHEMSRLAWEDARSILSGQYRRMPGLTGRAYVYVPAGYQPHFDFPLAKTSARLTHVGESLWMQEVTFESTSCDWQIPFDRVSR